MLGVGHRLGPLPHFSAIPKVPEMEKIEFKKVEFRKIDMDKPEIFANFSPKLTEKTPLNESKNRAVAWVLRVNVSDSAHWIEQLQAKKYPAYLNPEAGAHESSVIFIGPYVYQQEAEQVQKNIKTAFGLSGDVVKFDPLAVPS